MASARCVDKVNTREREGKRVKEEKNERKRGQVQANLFAYYNKLIIIIYAQAVLQIKDLFTDLSGLLVQ